MTEQNCNTPKNSACNTSTGAKSSTMGEHPVAVGVGAIGAGAVAGAAGGAIGGPVGALAGAAVGAVVGGMAGKAAGEAINPAVETKFWREAHPSKS